MKRFYQMETEKKVKAVCAALIAHRYLCKMKWVSQEGERTKDVSPEFMFCEDHEDEVRARLEAVGYDLDLDPLGNFYICAPQDDIGVRYERLDRAETLFLFGLAVTYENKRSEMGRFATVDSDMNELLGLLCVTYRAFDKEPSTAEVRRIMARFERAGVVLRKRGRWSDLDVEFAIQPAIVHVADRATIDAYERRYAAALDGAEAALDATDDDAGDDDDE